MSFSACARHLARRRQQHYHQSTRARVYAWGGKSSDGHAVGQRAYAPMRLYEFAPSSVDGVPFSDAEWRVDRIATGVHHSLVVCVNAVGEERLVSCGLGENGQLGFKSEEFLARGVVQLPPGLKIKGMDAGREHSIVWAQRDGKDELYTFGHGMFGQLGDGRGKWTSEGLVRALVPERIAFDKKVKFIGAGLDHSVIVTTEDQAYTMGWNSDGQLGLGHTNDVCTPTRIQGLPDSGGIRKLTTLTDSTFLLYENGDIWGWGNSEYSQITFSKAGDRIILAPRKLDVPFKVQDVSSGSSFTLLLADGNVHVCGFGILGIDRGVFESYKLSRVSIDSPVRQVVGGLNYSSAITEDGSLWMWGFNLNNRLGVCSEKVPIQWVPRKVELPGDFKATSIALGFDHWFVT